MRVIVNLMYVAVFALTFLGIFNIFLYHRGLSLRSITKKQIEDVKNSDNFQFWLYRKEAQLIRRGADFFLLKKDGFSIVKWYTIKILIGVVFGIITAFIILVVGGNLSLKILLGAIIGFVAGFFIFDVLLYFDNKNSNKEMMDDIMEMSRSVLYSNRGGQYITKAITSAMFIVENPRLKVAMLRLKYNLDSSKPLAEAIEEFESHFENAEISAFCTVIKSLQETGQVNDALSTLRANIEREQVAVNKRKCDRLESKTQINCVLIFAGIILCLVYILFMFIASIVSGF